MQNSRAQVSVGGPTISGAEPGGSPPPRRNCWSRPPLVHGPAAELRPGGERRAGRAGERGCGEKDRASKLHDGHRLISCGCASRQYASSLTPSMRSRISSGVRELGHLAFKAHALPCFLIERIAHVLNHRAVVRVNVIGVSLPDSPGFVQYFASSAQRPSHGSAANAGAAPSSSSNSKTNP